jgi:hypothetical protein
MGPPPPGGEWGVTVLTSSVEHAQPKHVVRKLLRRNVIAEAHFIG